jgi:hypothetical protein
VAGFEVPGVRRGRINIVEILIEFLLTAKRDAAEQDHRTVKKRVWLAKGYGSF